jgi:hypothetical protein
MLVVELVVLQEALMAEAVQAVVAIEVILLIALLEDKAGSTELMA